MKFENLVQLSEEIQSLDEPFFQPVLAGDEPNLIGSDRFKAVVSSKEKEILSVVSSRYSIVQSKDVLRSVVSALRGLGIHDVQGTIVEQNGRTYARILLPKYISEGSVADNPNGTGKDIQLGFLLINSYDGSKSLSLSGYALRLVCTNGMVAPQTLGKALVRKHVGDIDLKVEEAVKEIVDNIVARSPLLQTQIEKAIAEKYEDFDDMEEKLVESGFTKKTAAKILQRIEYTSGKYSRWSLYNAVTSFYTRKKMTENGRISQLRKAEALLCA